MVRSKQGHPPASARSLLGRCSQLAGPLLFAAAMFTAWPASAGELKLGATELATDDQGKLTNEGRKAAVTELPSLPGEDTWHVHLWAKLDKGAPGPLYVEFFGKHNGKPYKLRWHHEHAGYQGEKYVSMEFDIEGNYGFNKGKSYTAKVVQVGKRKQDIVLASATVKLKYTEPSDDPGASGSGEEDLPDQDEQDEHDSLAGPDEPPQEEGPPEIEPESKKGCRLDPTPLSLPACFGLFAMGAVLRPRRRRDQA